MPYQFNLVQAAAADLLRGIGEDLTRDGLRDTPARMAAAWAHWTVGYNQDPATVLKTFGDAEYMNEMVFQNSIPVFSLCEHHLVPFFGYVHIGYVPAGNRVVGLSKLARLVDIFARRLQVQERLTVQIADTLMKHLKPLGAGVVIQCRHLCMESRGVQKIGTTTTTSALRGVINEGEPRSEFLRMVAASMNGVKSL